MNNNSVDVHEWTNCNYLRNEKIEDWLSMARTSTTNTALRTWKEEVRIDAVGVIAFYRRMLHYDCIVLVKRYRPSLNAYTIEMPTGSVKDNETAGESALRELKDCCSFTGRVKKIGPVLAKDSDASNCAMRLVTVEVNGDDISNRCIKQSSNSDNFKECLLIPVSELLDKLSSFSAAGFLIDSRLDSFAIGLVMGNHNRKNKTPTSLIM